MEQFNLSRLLLTQIFVSLLLFLLTLLAPALSVARHVGSVSAWVHPESTCPGAAAGYFMDKEEAIGTPKERAYYTTFILNLSYLDSKSKKE